MSREPRGRRARPSCLALALAALPLAGVTADYDWVRGDFSATGIPSSLGTADVLRISGSASKTFSGGNFSNAGTVQWFEAAIHGTTGASVLNTGLWESYSDTNTLTGSGTLPTFTNRGTLRKSQGSGATTIGNWHFVNDGGIVEAKTGQILFSGGLAVFQAGTRFQGAGSVGIGSNASFQGSFLADNLVLASGVFSGADAKLAGGVAGTGGALAWTGGDLAGSWEIAAGSTLTASGAGAKRQSSGSLLNRGTVLWASAASFQGGGNAGFVNEGLFHAQASTSLATFSPVTRNTFTNRTTGVVRAADGVTLSIEGLALVSDGGEFHAAGAGSSILYRGGFASFEDGTRFTGPGMHVISNDARFVGTFHAANVQLAGGTQTGGDGATAGSKAILQGAATWTGGNVQGAWQVAAGSTLRATGAGGKQQVGGSIVNDGSMLWEAPADFRGGNGATLLNNGLFEARTTASIAFSGSGNRNAFTNAAGGMVRAANGATLTIGNVALTSNGGQFDAQAGSAIVYAAVNAWFGDGTRFTGAGTHTVQGDARFVGAIEASQLAFVPGGTRSGGDPAANGSKALFAGALRWEGGDLQGAWDLTPGSSVAATGTAARAIAGGSATNRGTITWSSSASLQMGNGASLRNEGVFDIATDADIVHSTGMTGSFENAGRLVKSGGKDVTVIGNVAFSNTGTIEVRTGTLQLPMGFRNEGVLTGSATYAVNGFLVNAGRVSPGASPGTLTVAGQLRQEAGGVLEIEVGSATLHDQLIVSGQVLLGGTLELVCFADCRMEVGETVSVLSFQSNLGNSKFDAITLSGFARGGFETVYEAAGLRLVVTEALAPVPEPQTYALMLSGVALVAWALRRRRSR